MNRRPLISVCALAVSLACWGMPVGAMAQVPPPPGDLPHGIRTDAAPEKSRDQIEAFIKGHLARALATDAKASQSSREAIIAELTAPNSSAQYKDLYGQTLSGLLLPMLSEPEIRPRLVAALIGGRAAVALAGDNAVMGAVAAKALTDKNTAVVIHGLKAARGTLTYATAHGKKSPLYAAVAAVAVAHASEGEIVADASAALSLGDLTVVNSLPPTAVEQLIGPVLQMLDARAELYKKEIPELSDTDRDFLNFFAGPYFRKLTPAQQLDVLQRAVDMLYAFTRTSAATTEPAAQRTVALQGVNIGRSLAPICDEVATANPSAAAALTPVVATLKSFSRTLPPASAEIEKVADALVDALAKIPAYKSIAKPTAN